MQIITVHDTTGAAPPSEAWTAHYVGLEETGPYGCGPTEAEAIFDLVENYAEPDMGAAYDKRRDDQWMTV